MSVKWTDPPGWLKWGWVLWLRNPFVLLRLSLIGLALTTLTWYPAWEFFGKPAGEPPVVFHLSYFAVWVSFATMLLVTDIGEVAKE